MNSEDTNRIFFGDNLDQLRIFPGESVQLIYIDPPFNTGHAQQRLTRKSMPDSVGTPGFQGRKYRQEVISRLRYQDDFADYWVFLEPRLVEARRILKQTGTLYLHLDYREAHYAKVLMDEIFGRDCFLNEIIWAYDYGARSKSRWPAKHDTILVYVRDPRKYFFDSAEVDREPYMAPGLVTEAKAKLGKLPTDVWWHTIVSPTGKEKNGYPTQKPLGVLRRIIAASSAPGDHVLDFFAGSGTTGEAASELGRRFTLMDSSPDAIKVMTERFQKRNISFELFGVEEAEQPGRSQ